MSDADSFDYTNDIPFYEEIAKIVCEHYNLKLSQNGKPKPNEWTVLAAIVQTSLDPILTFKVVSIATGTKCLGAKEVSPTGHLVSDSHAEVLARRAFQCYLYSELRACLADNKKSIFTLTSEQPSLDDDLLLGHKYKTFKLLESVEFHLFISEIPCGDAGIFDRDSFPSSSTEIPTELELLARTSDPWYTEYSKQVQMMREMFNVEVIDLTGDEPRGDVNPEYHCHLVEARNDAGTETNSSHKLFLRPHIQLPNHNETRRESEHDECLGDTQTNLPTRNRTGAKIHNNGVGMEKYEPIQLAGACRVKPGKGDPTLSMSCSDKIAKWHLLGLQGCLLSNFIPIPIRFTTIVIGYGLPFEQNAMARAVHGRFDSLTQDYISRISPFIYQSTQHNFLKDLSLLKSTGSPAAGSIISHLKTGKATVRVVGIEGRKLGATKKNWNHHSTRLPVCRKIMFDQFLSFLTACYPMEIVETYRGMYSYFAVKQLTKTKYSQNWNKLKTAFMRDWTEKPPCQIGFCNFGELGIVDLPNGFVEGIEVEEQLAKLAKEWADAEDRRRLRSIDNQLQLDYGNEVDEMKYTESVNESRVNAILGTAEKLLKLRTRIERNRRKNLKRLQRDDDDDYSDLDSEIQEYTVVRALRSNLNLTTVPISGRTHNGTVHHFAVKKLPSALGSEELLQDLNNFKAFMTPKTEDMNSLTNTAEVPVPEAFEQVEIESGPSQPKRTKLGTSRFRYSLAVPRSPLNKAAAIIKKRRRTAKLLMRRKSGGLMVTGAKKIRRRRRTVA